MKTTSSLLALFLGLLACSTRGQEAKKDPFAGFGNTGLDRKKTSSLPALPAAKATPPPNPPTTGNPAPAQPGLHLSGNWDASNGLARGGPKTQRNELRTLLSRFAQPARDTGPHPGMRIYRDVTYLLLQREAQARLGLSNTLQSGGRTSAAGFPDGLSFASFSVDAGRAFEVRLIKDRADQIVAVEFVAANAAALPPPPDPLPTTRDKFQVSSGGTYDFVPEGITAVSRRYQQLSWDLGDYILISTRGGPRQADLYLPKAMASLILYCLDLPPGQ